MIEYKTDENIAHDSGKSTLFRVFVCVIFEIHIKFFEVINYFSFKFYLLATNWEPRIVGGVPAYRGEFPDIVRIIYTDDEGNDRSICGGVIATWGRILTAAHCVYDDQRAYRYRVIAGSHRRDELNGAEQYRAVKRIWIPSTYNP